MLISVQSVVNCSETNEAFHGQLDFVRDGSCMVLQHPRKAA